MKQLELFDGMDEVRYVMSLTPEQFALLHRSLPDHVYDRVRGIRNAVHRWNRHCEEADREYRARLEQFGITW